MKFVLFLAFVVGANAMVCPTNFCDNVQCSEDVSACPQENLGRTFCGCCPTCVTMLGEGHACSPLAGILLGVPAGPSCGAGLECKNGVCTSVTKRATGQCAMEKQRVESQLLAAQQNGHPLLGLHAPDCDYDGNYSPRQCTGSVCICVMKDGNKIGTFSGPIWESNTQTCQCARDMAEYMATGLIGRLFHCTNNGNYQTYQCMGSVCYCTDTNGNQVGNQTASIGELNMLKC